MVLAQGPQWELARATVMSREAEGGDGYISMQAWLGDGPDGEIAIDDLTVTFGECSDDVTTVSDDDDDDGREVVVSCDFDSSGSDDGVTTGCPGVELSELTNNDFDFASTSDSADTGPSADHTGNGGKSYN